MNGPDIREELTRKIVALLEKGETLPWQKPWEGVPVVPYNALTGKPYKGVNRMWLGFGGYADPRWLTVRQVQALAQQTKTPLHVRKGEKGTPIEKWLFDREETQVDPETGRTETVMVSRDRPVALTFTVFNAGQIEGMPPAPEAAKEIDWPSDVLTRHIVTLLSARVLYDGGDRAFYRRGDDTIHLPVRSAFESSAGYNSTLLHELVHWTGHESRLAASFGAFGSERYAFEELRAEIGSYYLNGKLGLSNDLQNHVNYVKDWMVLLKKDKHALPRALRAAGQAEEFVLRECLEKEREPGIEKRLGAHLERLGISGWIDRGENAGSERREFPDRNVPDRTDGAVSRQGPEKKEGPAREGVRVYEERAPAGRRFAPHFSGVQDGGRTYVAESNLDLQGAADRMGPHQETGNGTLIPHGWRALRGEVPERENPVRIYVTDWRLEPETIQEFFRTHGTPLSDRDVRTLGETLDFRDPVLAFGLPGEDGGSPLLRSWQALALGYPVEILRCVESSDAGKSREGLDGLSVFLTPQAGWVGLDPAEVVRRGRPDGNGWLWPHPTGQATIQSYRLDGFEAFRVTEQCPGRSPGGSEKTVEDRGAASTFEAAQKIVREICRDQVEKRRREEGERERSGPGSREREKPDEKENALKIGSPGIKEMPITERVQILFVREGKTTRPARDDGWER